MDVDIFGEILMCTAFATCLWRKWKWLTQGT